MLINYNGLLRFNSVYSGVKNNGLNNGLNNWYKKTGIKNNLIFLTGFYGMVIF